MAQQQSRLKNIKYKGVCEWCEGVGMCVGGGYLSRIQYTGAGSKALVLLPPTGD